MSKELNITTGISGQSWTASTYLLGVAQTTGIAIGEIGTSASYSGDMTGAAGVYLVLFFLAASGQATFGGVINWDGAKEILPTGDTFARLGAPVGASISADIATRSTYAGGAVASVTGAVGSVTGLTASDVGAIKTTIGAAGAGLTALGDVRLVNLDAAVSTRTKPADTQAAVTLVGTTTNLTNAPTAGDLTAAMKTSVTTAATAATPTVAAVTAAVGVTGDLSATMKASVTTAATAATPNLNATYDAAKTAATQTSVTAIATTLGTMVAAVATAVWGAATRTLSSALNIVLAKGTGVTGFNDVAATDIVTAGPLTTSGGVASADIKAVNGVVITGAGVEGSDEWRPL